MVLVVVPRLKIGWLSALGKAMVPEHDDEGAWSGGNADASKG